MLPDQHKKIYDRIKNGEPVKISFKYISEDILILVNSIISRVLSKHDLQYIIYFVITILRELIVNSFKANAKRLFFLKNNLDISNPSHYNTGIVKFKDEIIGDFESLKDDILMSNNSIIFKLNEEQNAVSFSVKNSVPILNEEMRRINQRFAAASGDVRFNDIYETLEDETEGAGLGIALIIMFLKNMGIEPSTFTIVSNETMTVASFKIPYRLKPLEVITIVKKKILEEITGLPTFPENIMALLQMCSDPDVDIEQVARKIKVDVALTSDVLKYANSAGFITTKRTDDISMAVVKIGLKNLKYLLLASNARKILESRYSKFEEIWEHCNKVAFYSKQIAVKSRLEKITVDNAYVAGLLHDLGHVILFAVDINAVKRIAEIVQNRNIVTATVMEELAIGISHADIGRLVSEKWNFPEFLTQTIGCHHAPLTIPEKYRDICYSVYLANMLAGIERKKYHISYIEEMVLERFGITDEDQLLSLHEELKKQYQIQREP
jgi:HD-like signal output (HDOD) protein